MASAGNITWDLIANSSKFVSELDKANKAGKNWGDKLGKAAKGVATTFAAAGAAAAAGLAALYTVTASNIDEQAKFADKIGVSTDALAGLQHAGDLTGVSTETMNQGLQRMTRRVAEAAQGTGVAVDALDRLNLSAEDLNQLSPDEQFLAIADAMGDVESRSDQVALAFKLFDSGGVALLNTMDMASDGIRDAMEQAEHLGIALNRVDAAQVENANDAFDNMTKVSSGISRQLTVAFAPAVEAVSTKMLELALETEWVGDIGTTVFNAVVKGAGYAADAVYGISLVAAGVRAAFMDMVAAVANAMRRFSRVIATYLNLTWGNLAKMVDWIYKQLAKLVRYGEKLPGRAGEWAREIADTYEKVGTRINKAFQFDSDKIEKGIDGITNAAKKANQEFEDIANQELPSDKINKVVGEWQDVSRETAEAEANAKNYNDTLQDIDPGQLTKKQQDAQAQALQSLQRDLGYQEKIIRASYIERVKMINELVLTEAQVEAAGFKTLLALRSAYIQDAKDLMDKALEDLEKAEENARIQQLDSLQRSLGYQEQVINRSYQNQIDQINELVLTEAEVRAAGFDSIEALRAEYTRKTIQAREKELQALREEDIGFWQAFATDVENATQNFSDLWTGTFHKFTSDFGDAVADAVMTGEGFGDAMDQIAEGFARSMISALVQIATQQMVVWLLNNTILKKKQKQEAASINSDAPAKVQMAGLNAFNSTAAIPIYGPAAAPAAAATAIGLATPMATAAIAAANSGLAGMAHSGIDSIPEKGTWLLERGERVLSAKQNQDLMQFLEHPQPAESVVYSPSIVVEAGASQNEDLAFAERVIDEVFNRLVQDGRVNGPVRRAMNG